MFGSRSRPEPPARVVWADATKQKLDDIQARKNALFEKIKELDVEAQGVKALCNHTFPDGTSASREVHDSDPYDGWPDRTYSCCKVCGQ